MSGQINNYGLGLKGVNVDKSAIHLDDGEVTKAQNMTRDVLVDGAVRKRPGQVKVNSVAAAGSIGGVIGVPIAKPSTRRLVFGRWSSNTVTAWNTSTDEGATWATTNSPIAFDANAAPRSPQKMWTSMADVSVRQRAFAGRPSVMYRGRLYYAGNDYTLATTAPSIRMWDGVTDYLFANIPNNPDTGALASSAVMNMIAANQKIYFSTLDGGSYAANTLKTRLFEMDPEGGSIIQLGSRFPFSPETARVPYALAWNSGRLWTRSLGAGISAVNHKVYFIRPGIDTDWTLDATEATDGDCIVMLPFQGQMYMGTARDTGLGAQIRKRTTLGVYSTVVTAVTNEGGGTPIMVSLGQYNHFGAMAVFNNALYVSYFNIDSTPDAYSRIYKFDGTTWSVVYAPAKNTVTAVPFHSALVDNGKLYFISGPAYDGTHNVNAVIRTPDGTTWTDVSTGLTDSSTSTVGVIVT